MIKFLDLKSVNHRYEDEFKKVFESFLNNGQYILGEQVIKFENEFADYCGTSYAIGVSNGLDALKLIFEAYKAIGTLKNGDEILVPANTYIATVLAISNAGLKPILVEPNIETYNIDTSLIEAFLTPKTRAILGVHLYGDLYNVIQLERISKEHNLLLIEDAAQAHGAVFKDARKAGNLSDIAAFSFYPTKNLGSLGDAGAVTTNSKKLYDIILKLRNYGRSSIYKNDLKGFNCRLDELQASFLRIKLKHLDSENNRRKEIAKYYIDNINSKNIKLPFCKDINQHVFHQFVIKCSKRNQLKEYLFKNGVEALIHYPIAIHKQKAYKEWNYLNLPITEQLNEEVLSIPINNNLSHSNLVKIIETLNNW